MNLIFNLFVILSISCVVYSQQRQCAEIGGYCQNHWECCSNSCLSFSYRCVRSSQPVQPQVQQSTFNLDSIQDITNRFSGNEAPVQSAPVYSPQAGLSLPEAFQSIDELVDRYNNVPSGVQNNQQPIRPMTQSRFGETTCAQIGQTCYSHSECCSMSCHNYLKKCVT